MLCGVVIVFVSVGDEGIIWECAEFVMVYAAVPWRRSGNVGMMMALGLSMQWMLV